MKKLVLPNLETLTERYSFPAAGGIVFLLGQVSIVQLIRTTCEDSIGKTFRAFVDVLVISSTLLHWTDRAR